MNYPVAYVKDDRQQWAGSPAAEVRLKHDGWRPKAADQDEPDSVEAGPSAATAPDAGEPPKNRRRPTQ